MRRWVWLGLVALGCGGARPIAPQQPRAGAPHATDATKQAAALEGAKSLASRANQLFAAQRYAAARAATEQGLLRLARGSLDSDWRRYQLEMIRGESFRYEGNLAAAVPAFAAAWEAASRHERELRAEAVEATLRLSATLVSLKRNPEALAWLERGLMIAEGDNQTSDSTIRVASALASAYERAGRSSQADAVLARYVSSARLLNAKSGDISDIRAALVYETPSLGPAASGSLASSGSNPGSPSLASSGATGADSMTSAEPTSGASTPAPDANDEPTRTSFSEEHGPGVSNAAVEVAAMRAEFRACYQRALVDAPELHGSVRIVIRVGADGHVVDARGAAFGLRAPDVDCLLKRAVLGVFAPPQGGSAIIAVPVTFVKQ